MNNFLSWLEETTIAEWVASSTWGYAITLSSHGVGMAIVVGLTAIIAIRILGFPAVINLSELRKLLPVLFFGLLLNFVSGIALFMAAASEFFYNIAFQIKILMIVIGLFLVFYLDKSVLKRAAAHSDVDLVLSKKTQIFALMTILIWWLSVVLSGRLIGYVIYV
jgi:hypothetical protein